MDTRTIAIHAKLQMLAAQYRLVFSVTRVPENPNIVGAPRPMVHWHCTITNPVNPAHPMSTYFSMGEGHKDLLGNPRQPQLHECLLALRNDAAGVRNTLSYVDWCRSYGFNPMSQHHQMAYGKIQVQTIALQKCLGAQLFAQLFELN